MDERTDQKNCGKCRQALPLDRFTPSQQVLAGSWCRECHKSYRRDRRAAGVDERTERAATHCGQCGEPITGRRGHARFCSTRCGEKAWRKAHPQHVRRWTLKNVYGITDAAVVEMLAQQGGACAICGDDKPGRWCVDHSHSSGRVRGILCSHCNSGLGMFRDNADSLTAAIAYLARAAS